MGPGVVGSPTDVVQSSLPADDCPNLRHTPHEHLDGVHELGDAGLGGVEHVGAVRLDHRRLFTFGVESITFEQVLHSDDAIELVGATLRSFLVVTLEVDLERRLREDDAAEISALDDAVVATGELLLPLADVLPHARVVGDVWHQVAHRRQGRFADLVAIHP